MAMREPQAAQSLRTDRHPPVAKRKKKARNKMSIVPTEVESSVRLHVSYQVVVNRTYEVEVPASLDTENRDAVAAYLDDHADDWDNVDHLIDELIIDDELVNVMEVDS